MLTRVFKIEHYNIKVSNAMHQLAPVLVCGVVQGYRGCSIAVGLFEALLVVWVNRHSSAQRSCEQCRLYVVLFVHLGLIVAHVALALRVRSLAVVWRFL